MARRATALVAFSGRAGEKVTAEACLIGYKSRSKRVRTQCAWEVADTQRAAARKALRSLKSRYPHLRIQVRLRR
jgi:hypothetical protein